MLTLLVASTPMGAQQSLQGREKDLDRVKGLTTLAKQLIHEASELMAREDGTSSTKMSPKDKERDLDRVKWLKTLAKQLRREASELEAKWSQDVSTLAHSRYIARQLTRYS